MLTTCRSLDYSLTQAITSRLFFLRADELFTQLRNIFVSMPQMICTGLLSLPNGRSIDVLLAAIELISTSSPPSTVYRACISVCSALSDVSYSRSSQRYSDIDPQLIEWTRQYRRHIDSRVHAGVPPGSYNGIEEFFIVGEMMGGDSAAE